MIEQSIDIHLSAYTENKYTKCDELEPFILRVNMKNPLNMPVFMLAEWVDRL